MIARLWHGAVPGARGDDYMRYLEKTGLPDYRATPGNRGVYVLRREERGLAHFLLVTLWENEESIRAFAGEDMEKAKYYPEDRHFLVELEPTVIHYEVEAGP